MKLFYRLDPPNPILLANIMRAHGTNIFLSWTDLGHALISKPVMEREGISTEGWILCGPGHKLKGNYFQPPLKMPTEEMLRCVAVRERYEIGKL